MRKIILASLFTIASFASANACDICGCGVGNYNPFLFPHLSRNYWGLTWIYRHYITYADDGSKGNEYYNSVLLSGQYSPFRRLQLSVMVPYQLNGMNDLDGKKNISGIGDISFLANYKLLDKTSSEFRHSIVAGIGIKLPTGKFIPAKTIVTDGQNFQAGTGSTDYLLNASYHFGWKNWTFSAASSYKYNTQNKNNYRFGDVFINGITAVYQKQIKNISFSPYLQLINEKQMKAADNHVLQSESGGKALYMGGGLDITSGKISGGINYQFAADQDLAEGNVVVKPRFSAHLLFTL